MVQYHQKSEIKFYNVASSSTIFISWLFWSCSNLSLIIVYLSTIILWHSFVFFKLVSRILIFSWSCSFKTIFWRFSFVSLYFFNLSWALVKLNNFLNCFPKSVVLSTCLRLAWSFSFITWRTSLRSSLHPSHLLWLRILHFSDVGIVNICCTESTGTVTLGPEGILQLVDVAGESIGELFLSLFKPIASRTLSPVILGATLDGFFLWTETGIENGSCKNDLNSVNWLLLLWQLLKTTHDSSTADQGAYIKVILVKWLKYSAKIV